MRIKNALIMLMLTAVLTGCVLSPFLASELLDRAEEERIHTEQVDSAEPEESLSLAEKLSIFARMEGVIQVVQEDVYNLQSKAFEEKNEEIYTAAIEALRELSNLGLIQFDEMADWLWNYQIITYVEETGRYFTTWDVAVANDQYGMLTFEIETELKKVISLYKNYNSWEDEGSSQIEIAAVWGSYLWPEPMEGVGETYSVEYRDAEGTVYPYYIEREKDFLLIRPR